MKKFCTLVAFVAVALSAVATTFSFSNSVNSQTIDGITVTLSKGSGNNDPAVYSDNVRLYASNTITISGANLTSISLSFTKQGSKDYASLSASAGSLVSGGNSTSNEDVKTDKWTGSVSSVTFTLGDKGQRIIKQIVVNGDGSETDPSNPSNPGDGGDSGSLDNDYVYAEPTVVTSPDKTVQGDAYSFVSNNINVSCTKGAVTESYFSAHAGFEMTFTATKAIKGIVINGLVKKGFEATANHGEISFLSPSEDVEANPVVVLTDVDSKSVTVSCVKQLRCYSVKFYFEENPDATVAGGGAGSTQTFTIDFAEAVFESEYSEMIGENNYSIFLYNLSETDYSYLALDIYPAEKDNLVGTYSMSDWSLGDYTYYVWGEGEDDFAWAYDGEVVISKEGDIYTIEGFVYCENNVTYEFSYTGEMPMYLDTDYYDDDYDDSASIESVAVDKTTLDENAPMYNLQGRRVGAEYKGVVIQNGRKFILR